MTDDLLTLAGRTFRSRLIVGTGKYPSNAVMAQAHEASGAEMVTVAVRRVNIADRSKESLLDYIDPEKYTLLPNTAGCFTADEAVRTACLAREAGLSNWVKLEVIGDERTLFPDNEALVAATQRLVRDDFVVLPYTNDDPVTCRKLEDAGAAAVMPLGAPIGSGLGIQNPNNLRIIKEFARVPVIVDAGVGTPSDAAIAMELGADAVLMNTGIAGARDPVAMARAMRLAIEAGRAGLLAGRIPARGTPTPAVPWKASSGVSPCRARRIPPVHARSSPTQNAPTTRRWLRWTTPFDSSPPPPTPATSRRLNRKRRAAGASGCPRSRGAGCRCSGSSGRSTRCS